MDIYRQQILQHYKHPHNHGKLQNPSRKSKATNRSCGDEIEIDIITKNGKVIDIAFEGKGCVISTASASMLTEYVKGKSIQEIQKMNYEDMIKLIGIKITPARLKCLLLPLEATQKAVS